MQLNRLLEMIYLLLERECVTAKEFAEHFEISTRTVYRDVEALSQAGIPIYMVKGSGGGIRLEERFTLKNALLSENEQQEILASLQGLSALPIPAPDREQTLSLLHKLSGAFQTSGQPWLDVDLSDWSDRRQQIFEEIKQAILQRRVICFDYYAGSGQKTARKAEPVQLWFKDKSWYLRAFCLEKMAMRTFRLTRMKRITVTQEHFSPRELPEPTPGEACQPPIIRFTLRIDPSQAYRVYDDFEEEEITAEADGSFIVHLHYPDGGWVYGMILSYGPYAEVLEPPQLRETIRDLLAQTLSKYR